MAGSSWNVFSPNTKAKSSEVNANFDWIEGDLVPMNAGSKTNAAYNLGEQANAWKIGYIDQIVMGDILSVTSAALQVNGDIDLGGADRVISNVSPNALAFATSDTTRLNIEASGTITANVELKLASGASVNEFSTDGTMAGNSDTAVPTEQAVVEYVTTKLVSAAGTGATGIINTLGSGFTGSHTAQIIVSSFTSSKTIFLSADVNFKANTLAVAVINSVARLIYNDNFTSTSDVEITGTYRDNSFVASTAGTTYPAAGTLHTQYVLTHPANISRTYKVEAAYNNVGSGSTTITSSFVYIII